MKQLNISLQIQIFSNENLVYGVMNGDFGVLAIKQVINDDGSVTEQDVELWVLYGIDFSEAVNEIKWRCIRYIELSEPVIVKE